MQSQPHHSQCKDPLMQALSSKNFLKPIGDEAQTNLSLISNVSLKKGQIYKSVPAFSTNLSPNFL